MGVSMVFGAVAKETPRGGGIQGPRGKMFITDSQHNVLGLWFLVLNCG